MAEQTTEEQMQEANRLADKQYIISASQVQSILRYLFTRPYGEVVQGIEVLSRGLKELDPNIKADFVAKNTDGKK
jgi:hypothetical protein|tara:strand:+ start:333 stop:557 length:225 start_codon:yes stop_codon:yes gene_type:complete